MLLRSIIVEREPIYHQHETVHGFADGMFGVSAREMALLGDDRLGRALDRLFDADRSALLTELVLAVGQRFGVRFDEFHNDSTTISLCGSYRAAGGRCMLGKHRYERCRCWAWGPPGVSHADDLSCEPWRCHRVCLQQALLKLLTYCNAGKQRAEVAFLHQLDDRADRVDLHARRQRHVFALGKALDDAAQTMLARRQHQLQPCQFGERQAGRQRGMAGACDEDQVLFGDRLALQRQRATRLVDDRRIELADRDGVDQGAAEAIG